jgi:hypothetical protein
MPVLRVLTVTERADGAGARVPGVPTRRQGIDVRHVLGARALPARGRRFANA